MSDIAERILYEDNHIIIINKNAGEIVQGDKTGDVPLSEKIKEFLKEKYQKPGNVFCGVIHRLDRPVSGVVIFAKTSKGLARMNELIKNREIKKIYCAIVEGKLGKKEDFLRHFLHKNEKLNKSFVVSEEKNGQLAELHYKVIKELQFYSIVEVELLTGRHHQIRVQLSTIGNAIKGDVKYGGKRPNRDLSISLHARSIEFTHPISKKQISISAPFPKNDLWKEIDNKEPISQ